MKVMSHELSTLHGHAGEEVRALRDAYTESPRLPPPAPPRYGEGRTGGGHPVLLRNAQLDLPLGPRPSQHHQPAAAGAADGAAVPGGFTARTNR